MKPVIGITTYSGVNDLAPDITEPTQHIPNVYLNAVLRAGGIPVLLPPCGSTQDAEDAAGAVDGILLPGGPDINPAVYGEEPASTTSEPDPVRDMWENSVFANAMVADIPLLGICRGMQLINVSLGGTLNQQIEHAAEMHQGRRGFIKHPVMIDPDSLLSEIMPYEDEAVDVPARHHQSIATLGNGLRAVAFTPDGVVEAVEHQDADRFVIGVQWHPERDSDQSLFAALVAAAEKRM